MNLCGGGTIDQQILPDTDSQKSVKVSALCGSVYINDHGNVDDQEAELIPVLTSSRESTSSRDNSYKQKSALDLIQQTLDVKQADAGTKTRQPVFVVGLPTALEKQVSSHASNVSPSKVQLSNIRMNCNKGSPPIPESPSPVLLNPLSFQDRDYKHRAQIARSKPNLVATRPPVNKRYDTISRHLKDGFFVYLHGLTQQRQRVHLYYDENLETLCMKKMSDDELNTVHDDVWVSIPMRRILRLEIGRSYDTAVSPAQCFSVIANQDADIKYYDYEAKTPIEREVLVSSLMLVLERVLNARDTDTNKCKVVDECVNMGAITGTSDQPIPCSPSLEQPGCEQNVALRYLSPRKRTEIHDVNENEGTEATLVIHLEDVNSGDDEPRTPCRDRSAVAATNKSFDHNGTGQEESLGTLSDDSDFKIIEAPNSEVALDIEKSPNSPVPVVPVWCAEDACTLALADLADTCSGLFALKRIQAKSVGCDPMSDEQMYLVEEYITTALGAPSAVCSYLSTGNVWRAETTLIEVRDDEANPSLNSKVQNRVSQLNAQASRLRELRNEMTFAAALKQSQERMKFVHTTQSFDDYDRNGRKSVSKSSREAANRFHSSALLQSVVNNMSTTPRNGGMHDEVLYYDSDPEDVRPQRSRRGLRSTTTRKNGSVKTIKADLVSQGNGTATTPWDKVKPSKRVSKRLDEDIIVELVQSLTNDRLTLMWHPTQSKKNPNRHPVCVKVWIESGVYLIDGTFLLPKLNWTKISESSLDTSHNWKLRNQNLNKIDLLDVCRIRATAQVDRKLHPFANTQRSFSIETQTDHILFEARTPEERDRLVYGFKLVIARLASLLMLRDARAAEEFFGAISASVPGEAPAWASSHNTAGGNVASDGVQRSTDTTTTTIASRKG